ncbi:hypothetical protein GRI58_03955 [Porphyrobacter algicida]|uniref:O-antigen ligase-related domain-containing protein n=1 Tax=Qipengyuania algicida TaxID=1836209 RepID=A0A845AGM6_9SPHN|nr:O-antigen ligase family protein [Qipengyuania algicida]MXP27975.1 hypothetical protein [Qipengyuania algicida]
MEFAVLPRQGGVRGHSRANQIRFNFPYWLLCAFFTVLWLAGGSSRADASGQVIVRASAWLIVLVMILLGMKPVWRRSPPVFVILLATITIVAIQLLPLPPALWTSLPGRAMLQAAAQASGELQPWRPIAIVPSAAVNALSSLVVPLVVVILISQLPTGRQRSLLEFVFFLVLGGAFLGLLQISGAHFKNPFYFSISGEISGCFANRNHFALFISIGCILTLVWAFAESKHQRWRIMACSALIPFFVLIVLGTGSRMGILTCVSGVVLGLLAVRTQFAKALGKIPKRSKLFIIGVFLLALATIIGLSIFLDRAVALNRLTEMHAGQDLRVKALPVILKMISAYFPVGSGFGGFDPVYRIWEPDSLLSPLYLNHAHDDWLEVILSGGILALLLLAASVIWWALASIRAWRAHGPGSTLPKVGSGALGLVLVASITDYPARTPMIMAIITIAAFWLGGASRTKDRP